MESVSNLHARTVIADSWRRAAMAGIRPADTPPQEPLEITELSASTSALLDAAREVLAKSAAQLGGTTMALVVADQNCRILSRATACKKIEGELDSVGVTPGSLFGEDLVGTNAIGTPAELRSGLIINGSEHYLDQFKSVSCYGLPIINPTTHRFVGSVCMTEISPVMNPLSVPFVNRISVDITDRLINRARMRHHVVLDAFRQASRQATVAVVAIDTDLQLMNDAACEMLTPMDIGVLRALALELTHDTAEIPITLLSNQAVTVSAYEVSGAHGAVIFRLWSTFSFVEDRVELALTPEFSQQSVAISGESGTGRTTSAFRVAAELNGEKIVHLDVPEMVLSGQSIDVKEVIIESREKSIPVIVDGVELLDETVIQFLCEAITRACVVLVLNSSCKAKVDLSVLVAKCPKHIETVPLRRRRSSLVSIAQGIVANIDEKLMLSPGAAEALLCQEWLGNYIELKAVLRESVASCVSRGSCLILHSDFPEEYQMQKRVTRLLGRERAERTAIVEAINICDGNKARAARELGISRTTLYARIRALGISSR